MWDAELGRCVDPLYEQWAAEARARQRLAAEQESQEGIGFWDWVQGGLDAGGVVEPTPFCDLASGVISAFRGNWADAGCSALAMIPYVGDTAKAAKYGRKVAKLANRAGDVAHAARAADEANDVRKAVEHVPGTRPGICFVAGTAILVPEKPEDTTAESRNSEVGHPGIPGRNLLLAAGTIVVGLAGWLANARRRQEQQEDGCVDEDTSSTDSGRARHGCVEHRDHEPAQPLCQSRSTHLCERDSRGTRWAAMSRQDSAMDMNDPCGDVTSKGHVPHSGRAVLAARAVSCESKYRCAPTAARLGRWWLSGCLLLASLLLGSSLPWRLGPRPAESAPAVAQPDRPRTQEIETIRVGQRVVARNPQPEAVPRTTAEVDPTTWRLLRLRAESRWPDGTLDVIHVETLQPAEWVEKHNALVGAAVPLPLDLLEMGLPEDLHARVVANEPCPPIAAGPGSIVLTTVNHLNPDAYSLALVNAEGRGETVRPTGLHKFYSANRGRWVNTEELKPGERLRGIDGWLTVTDVRRLPGVHRVYNMTVAGEHVFHVSRLGLVSHNNNPCAQAVPANVADKFRRTPTSLGEKLTLDEARAGAGQKIMDGLHDPRFQGMEKWQHVHYNPDGTKTVIHYVRDPKTGNLLDFKFKE